MTNRRDFIKASLAITAGMAATTNIAQALADKEANTLTLPDGIIYTKDNAGKWAKKVDGHLPIVTVDGKKVTVETKHVMVEKHYIVRHTIVTDKGEVVGEETFSPDDEKALSVFTIKGEYTALYATSFCNKHDLWVAEVKIKA